jgi:hypothetical protein
MKNRRLMGSDHEGSDDRGDDGVQAAPGFSDDLEAWLTSDEPKTIGALEEVFEERSFAVAILLLMFPSAIPIPTGGITHVFELLTFLLAGQMVLGRETPWIPNRWRERELGKFATGKALPFITRRVRGFEKISRPRGVRLFDQRSFNRILGVVIIVFTVGAFVAPPFSGLDTLPALGIVTITLAIILRDTLILGIGFLIGVGGIALIITLGAAAVRFFKNLF